MCVCGGGTDCTVFYEIAVATAVEGYSVFPDLLLLFLGMVRRDHDVL